jgi:hypothetical protein
VDAIKKELKKIKWVEKQIQEARNPTNGTEKVIPKVLPVVVVEKPPVEPVKEEVVFIKPTKEGNGMMLYWMSGGIWVIIVALLLVVFCRRKKKDNKLEKVPTSSPV